MPPYKPLPPSFYAAKDTPTVGRALLGQVLVRMHGTQCTAGRIVETEAYLGSQDPAAHTYRGETPRNRSMFGPAGRAYVYAIHAKYCLNVVSEPTGEAVLIRAIEPLVGLELMSQRRGRDKPLELARGPARLCQALDIGPQFDGWNLTLADQLWIAPGEAVPENQQLVGPRVGISSARERPLRFAVADNRFVSLPRATMKPRA